MGGTGRGGKRSLKREEEKKRKNFSHLGGEIGPGGEFIGEKHQGERK